MIFPYEKKEYRRNFAGKIFKHFTRISDMKYQIKHHLNLLLAELEQRQESETYSGENPFFPNEATGVGQFIKKVALEIKDYELIGMAEAICQKAQEIDDEEAKIDEEHQDWLRQEYWNSKNWFNATDIGSQLNPQLSAAKTNILLEKFGFQQHQGKGWVITDKAAGLCQQRDADAERPYIQWKLDIVDQLKAELKKICM